MTEFQKRLDEIKLRAEDPSLLFNSQDAHISLTIDLPWLLSLIENPSAEMIQKYLVSYQDLMAANEVLDEELEELKMVIANGKLGQK